MTEPTAQAPGPRAGVPPLVSRLAPVGFAVVLFATSMLVARSFATSPEPGAPGASGGSGSSQRPGGGPPGAYAGPALYGIFAGCNPACDLEVAVEGIGRRLTLTDRAIDESAPSLSPDRAQVVYRCAEPAVEPGGEGSPRPEGLGSLCLVPTIPPEDQEATFPPVTTLLTAPDVDYGAPAWSPDGSTVAFVARGADGESQLGLLDVASGTARDIPMDPVDPSSPAWSPDGTQLAFGCGSETNPEGGRGDRFCVMPRDGGAVTAIGTVGGECGAPAYAPDVVHLAVVCVVPDAEGGDLFFLALSEPVTHSITGDQSIAPEGQKRLVFSPDGRFVYVRRGDELWALEPATETWSLPPMPPLHGDFDLQVLE